jgi:proteasome lid subunit RPN8/RPN11
MSESNPPLSARPASPLFALAEKGDSRGESLDVYLHLDALEDILSAVDARDRQEAGGLVCGEAGQDGEGPFLLVRRALHATRARRERISLTFTPEAWEELWAAHDRECPDLAVVGWYHTHPGLSVFLSEPDQFIHRHFFTAAHQIALVYDPDEFRWGLFYWEADTLRAARGLYLYSEAARSYPALERALRQVAPGEIILHGFGSESEV